MLNRNVWAFARVIKLFLHKNTRRLAARVL
jgi:hypothetical protein